MAFSRFLMVGVAASVAILGSAVSTAVQAAEPEAVAVAEAASGAKATKAKAPTKAAKVHKGAGATRVTKVPAGEAVAMPGDSDPRQFPNGTLPIPPKPKKEVMENLPNAVKLNNKAMPKAMP
jgi:hypothetical protein